jgi:hypothetical protein
MMELGTTKIRKYLLLYSSIIIFPSASQNVKYHDINVKVKVKVKVKLPLCFFLTEHHAIKVYWGSESIVPLIL